MNRCNTPVVEKFCLHHDKKACWPPPTFCWVGGKDGCCQLFNPLDGKQVCSNSAGPFGKESFQQRREAYTNLRHYNSCY